MPKLAGTYALTGKICLKMFRNVLLYALKIHGLKNAEIIINFWNLLQEISIYIFIIYVMKMPIHFIPWKKINDCIFCQILVSFSILIKKNVNIIIYNIIIGI